MSDIDLKYFNHYAKHTYYVTLAWKIICEELWNHGMLTEKEFEKVTNNIIWHDQSKMDNDEWHAYAEKFYGTHSGETVKSAFKEAVKSHKSKNLHHYETLKEYKGDDWRCYIVELVCDYIAMGWEFDNYIFEYYNSVKDEFELPSEYQAYLDAILDILKDPKLYDLIEKPLTDELKSKLYFKDIILEPKQKA